MKKEAEYARQERDLKRLSCRTEDDIRMRDSYTNPYETKRIE